MKARAIQKNVHVSSRKANLICDLIRYKSVKEALVILDNAEKKTAGIIKKLLNSAAANATNNHQMNGDKLYIYFVTANQGSTIKRSLPRAKGSANMIRKRHSHLVIELSDDPKQREKDLMALKNVVRPHKASQIDSKIVSKPTAPVKKASVTPKVKLQADTTVEEIKKEEKKAEGGK
ncbi:50S ribosomal protein L22 [Bacilli bacterium]|nr:50S ribosomal protein L22 [Bacilli bacterium]